MTDCEAVYFTNDFEPNKKYEIQPEPNVTPNNHPMSLNDQNGGEKFSRSGGEYICRICHGGVTSTSLESLIQNIPGHESSLSSMASLDDKLISLCMCKGSMKYVHLRCLNKWRDMSTRYDSYLKCEQCNSYYKLKQSLVTRILQIKGLITIITLAVFLSVYGGSYGIAKLTETAWNGNTIPFNAFCQNQTSGVDKRLGVFRAEPRQFKKTKSQVESESEKGSELSKQWIKRFKVMIDILDYVPLDSSIQHHLCKFETSSYAKTIYSNWRAFILGNGIFCLLVFTIIVPQEYLGINSSFTTWRVLKYMYFLDVFFLLLFIITAVLQGFYFLRLSIQSKIHTALRKRLSDFE
jgi:hypothetical protein